MTSASLLAQTRIFAGRSMLSMLRSRTVAVTAVVIPTVFFLGFYAALRSRLRLYGVDYEQFLTPAVGVQSIFTVAIGTGYATAEDASTGLLRRFAAMPIHAAAPALGRGIADGVRGLATMAVVVVVGMAFGFRFDDVPGGLAFVVLAAAVSLVLSFALTLAASRAASPEALVATITLPYLPILMLSTAFVPAEGFPGWLEPVARNSPVSALIDGLRACAAGDPTSWTTAKAAIWVGVLAAGLLLALRGRPAR